jgi:hypothetical protein
MSNDFFENLVNDYLSPEAVRSAIDSGTSSMARAASSAKIDIAKKAAEEKNAEYEKEKANDKYRKYTASEFYEYPSNVGVSEEQPHSVIFTINVRENSRVAGASTAQDVERDWQGPVNPNLKSAEDTSQNTLNKDQLETGNSVAVGLGGALLGVGFVGAVGKGPASTLGLGVGAAVGIGGAALAKSVLSSLQTQGTVRTLGAITLHVAAPPIAQYSANWENKELGSLAALGSKFFNDDGSVSTDSILAGIKGSADTLGRNVIKAAAKLPSETGITGDIGSIIDLSTGKILNPYKEQLFNSMNFRQFAFNYKFNPKDRNEYNNVKAIIETFKYHMHPERVNDGIFLQYPSEFEIEYQYKGSENTHISKISTCALTDLKVTYGNQDSFTTVQGTNGAPAEINMQLGFTELEILSNERIADGY